MRLGLAASFRTSGSCKPQQREASLQTDIHEGGWVGTWRLGLFGSPISDRHSDLRKQRRLDAKVWRHREVPRVAPPTTSRSSGEQFNQQVPDQRPEAFDMTMRSLDLESGDRQPDCKLYSNIHTCRETEVSILF